MPQRNYCTQKSRRVRMFLTTVIASAVCLLSTAPLSTEAAPMYLNLGEYPSLNSIPSTDSPQVRQWLSEIDLTGAPTILPNTGEPPKCPEQASPTSVCSWACGSCSSSDIVDCPDKNVWGLTFDDGPNPATPELLKFLEEKKVKASFFLVGANVIQFPEIAQEEAKAGHHLASNTWSHAALTTLSNEQIVAEMRWTEKAIEAVTGYRVRYMRAPYGDIDNRVRFVLHKLGYTIVDWTGDTMDSDDWKLPQVKSSDLASSFQNTIDNYINKTIANPTNNTRGMISLEHDLSPETVALAKAIIPYGLQHDLQIMTVAQCLHDTAPYAAINGVLTTPAGSVTNSTAEDAVPGAGSGVMPEGKGMASDPDLNQPKSSALGAIRSVRRQHFLGGLFFDSVASSSWSALLLGSIVAGMASL